MKKGDRFDSFGEIWIVRALRCKGRVIVMQSEMNGRYRAMYPDTMSFMRPVPAS